eukprot:COSAG01_NODE_4336_length_5125_cov_64.626542_1_plen_388_part_00
MDGTGLDFLVAQLTIPASVNSWSGTMGAQGPEFGPPPGQPGYTSWQEPRIEFCWHPAAGHDCGPQPEPEPEPAATPVLCTDGTDYTQALQAVSDSCCPGPRRCEHLPSSCSASCRLRFVPFMTQCAAQLPRQDLTEFRQFLPLCTAPPPPAPMLCSGGRQLVAALQQVSSDCCPNGNCVQLPSSCSGRCKSTFVTFMTYCQAQLSRAQLAQYTPFLQLCRAPPTPTPRLCNDNKTTYTDALNLVSNNCCSGPNDCASGRHLPSSCSASCRSIFVPFMTHCAALLPPQLQTNFTQFLPLCKPPPPPPPTPEPEPEPELCTAGTVYQARQTMMVSACCPPGAQCPPTSCDLGCKDAAIAFYRDCDAVIASRPAPDQQQLNSFRALCQAH